MDSVIQKEMKYTLRYGDVRGEGGGGGGGGRPTAATQQVNMAKYKTILKPGKRPLC